MPKPAESVDIASTDTGLERDARCLHEVVSELVRIYQFRDRKSICYYDISVSQCHALEAVIEFGPLTLNGLAAKLFLDKSTASRLVDSLVQKGYVSRSTDPDDGRALELRATRRGYDLHARIVRDLVEKMKDLLKDIDPETRKATIQLVERLSNSAAERFGRTTKCTEGKT